MSLTDTGARSNFRRQEAKEEVVKGKGYVFPSFPHRQEAFQHHTLLSSPRGIFFEPLLTNAVVKDKAQHAVVLDKATSDKLNKDVESYRLVTVAVLVDRLKINGSLARRALADLEDRGVIRKIVQHSSDSIYTRVTTGGD